MSSLDVAILLTRHGCRVVPVPHRSKNPGYTAWEQSRLDEADLPHHFNGRPQNIGILMGEPSGGLIDIDLDCVEAIALAPLILPPTGARFGRASKLLSHYLFRCSPPPRTVTFKDVRDEIVDGKKKRPTLVEFRSTGAQTIAPGSTHESGEAIEFTPGDSITGAAEVDAQYLLALFHKLGAATLLAKYWPGEGSRHETEKALAGGLIRAGWAEEDVTEFICAVAEVGGGEPGKQTRLRVAEYTAKRLAEGGKATGWTTLAKIMGDDVVNRVKEWLGVKGSCSKNTPAVQPQEDEQGLIKLGTRDPQSGKLVLSPRRTLPTAEAYVGEFHAHEQHRTLVCYAGRLMEWRDNHYAEIEDAAAKCRLQHWLHAALRYVFNRGLGEMQLAPFDSNPTTVNAALESIKTFTHLDASVAVPSWLDGSVDRLDPRELLCCKSLTLHIPSEKVLEPTPLLFNTAALTFDYDSRAAKPIAWLAFLDDLFGDDAEQIMTLQTWFGYCLTADTSQQKALLLIGPKRSGKGTIARILSNLIGIANVAGPTTGSLAGNFGLAPLIGKSLAIVSDARFSGENVATVVERLLCITGEDTLTIDRKFMPSVTMKLPTRFMFLSNELPRFSDSSAALAGRFILLRLTRSFYGDEITDLTDRLLVELPGILLWAVEGWKRLRAQGHFQRPSKVADVVQELEDLTSPVGAFVRERCVVGPDHRVCVDDLYNEWKSWCVADGRVNVSIKQVFSRDLYAAVPGVTCRQGTSGVRFYSGIGLGAPS